MLTTYAAFVDRMIGKYEGGYGWNRKDPGGPTKYGITCFDLAEHLGRKMDSMDNWAPIVKAMTLETAEQIYRTKYANALAYDSLPAGVDVVMMDYGVNSGIVRPIRVARALLGLPAGQKMDPTLLNTIKATDPAKFVTDMCAERLHFMHGIRGGSAWAEFGGGWGARVADLKSYALHLQAPDTVAHPTAPDLTNTALPKAQHGDPEITTKTVKKVVVGGSGAASSHFFGMPLELAAVLTGFVIVGGVAYVLHKKQMAAMANAAVVLPPPAR